MNMLLHGLPDARVEKGDTIREPKLVEDGALMQFDLVIANPPFSLDNWGREMAENDPWRRFRFGLPTRERGDLAFVQHMVASLNPTGRMAVVMPHGVLFRGGSEGEIRKGLIEEDLIEAVIGLPINLFYGTTIAAAVLVLSRAKPAERRGKLLFVDASKGFGQRIAKNYLREEDVLKATTALREYSDASVYSRLAPLDEVQEKRFNLSIGRYIIDSHQEGVADISVALESLRVAEQMRDQARARLNSFLRQLGYEI
jgi:type I restriction enzyme M protein